MITRKEAFDEAYAYARANFDKFSRVEIFDCDKGKRKGVIKCSYSYREPTIPSVPADFSTFDYQERLTEEEASAAAWNLAKDEIFDGHIMSIEKGKTCWCVKYHSKDKTSVQWSEQIFHE